MKKKRFAVAIAMAICFLFVTIFDTFSFAWMSDNGMSSPIDITSNVHKAYFASGDGTKNLIKDEDGEIISGPFEIANPVQFYYFAWLQYLGFFNEANENGVVDTIYFRLSADLDMHYIDEDGNTVKYVLPPIGTSNMPFLGNFDGEGHTITDLTVENQYDSLFEAPEGTDKDTFKSYAEIIGCFGVVGELTEGSYNYDTQANEVKNLILKDVTIKTQTNNALVGFVAGYVNGVVDCVGVVGATVDIKADTKPLSYTDNISDYSLIGFCTPNYKNDVYVLSGNLTNPDTTVAYTVVPEVGGEGNVQGWGGSVKMSDIVGWLTTVMTTGRNGRLTSTNSYVMQRTDVVALNGTTVSISHPTSNKNTYTVDGFGSFIGSTMSWSGNTINFLAGGQKVTQYTYKYTDEQVTVYYIKDGDYYMTFNGNAIGSTQDVNQATKWYASNGANGGAVYTVVNGRVYYLTINNNAITTILEVDAGIDNLPEWDFSGDNYSLDDTPIWCDEGEWKVYVPENVTAGPGDFKISYTSNGTTYYLDNSGTNAIQREENVNNAAVWTITQINGGYTISTVINNQTYYLGYSGNGNNSRTLTLSRTQATWQLNNQNCIYITSGYRTLYLRFDNNNWVLTNNNNNNVLTFTPTSGDISVPETDLISSNTTENKIVCEDSVHVDNSIKNGYYDNNGNRVESNIPGISYFPLSTKVTMGNNANADSYSIDDTNTGYIIGAEYGVNDGTLSEQDGNGNIRIATYGANSMENKTTPWTMSYKTGGKFKTISDRNESTMSNLGLQKYADCYQDYINSTASGCSGLHFMQASVSTKNMTRITAHLNGETYENYQVPTNCIDFNLYDRGFINFVAGSYFTAQTPQNNSFFSIYEIVRDPDDETSILEIKEIRKIYARMNGTGDNKTIDTSKPYYYTYLIDGNEVGTDKIPDGYEMVFDCRWITHPNDSAYYGASGGPSGWSNNRAFYFEVPVNAGEYAIGSTEGRTGAYLTYLDLAANAQLVERVKQYEEITENLAAGSIPNGVDTLLETETSADVDPFNSAFISINGGTSGQITVNKTGENEISHSATSGTTAEYVGVKTVLKDGNGNAMSMPITQTTKIERTTYRDHNLTTGVYTVTVITKMTVVKDGVTTVTYARTITTTDADGTVSTDITEPQSEILYPETKDTDTSPTTETGAKLIDFAFAYGQDVAAITYEYIPAGTDENGAATAPTYLITINNPGEVALTLKAILTQAGVDSGITFIITDGVTQTILQANTTAQTVVIAGKVATETPEETPDEPTDEPTT